MMVRRHTPRWLRRWLTSRKSLRYQLTVKVWLVMLFSFLISDLIITIRSVDDISMRAQAHMALESEVLAFGVARWANEMRNTVRLVSLNPAIRSLEPKAVNEVLDSISSAYPKRDWRIWSRDGRLIGYTGAAVDREQAERKVRSRPYFIRGLQGLSSYQMLDSVLADQPCLVASHPIYALGVDVLKPGGNKPVGIASFCLRLSDVGEESALAQLDQNLTPFMATRPDRLSQDEDDFSGRTFLLLGADGRLIFPTQFSAIKNKLQTPEAILEGPWGDFVRAARSHDGDSLHRRLSTRGGEYFLHAHRIDEYWTSINIVDVRSVYSILVSVMYSLVLLELLTLLAATMAIYVTCARFTQPIQVAGQAIRRLSRGDFDLQLEVDRSDEIGHLYADINETAEQLKLLVQKETSHAVTEKQIETARSIQKSFLVEDLPVSEHVQIAACFKPAYEIGADWYDALRIDDITFVVVADVCDKGVASALFMSVFRTLLRFSLLRDAAEGSQRGDDILDHVMTMVNNYMASTHGFSTMFATVFLAAYDPRDEHLAYVCAGHESPLILRGQELEALEVCGPAIGIFEGARFAIKHTPLHSGDLLFAYTDGLTDARSCGDEPWGLQHLRSLLLSLDPTQITAQGVVERVNAAVDAHRGSAEPFDDLTLLALHVT